jgi:hypothetical protein
MLHPGPAGYTLRNTATQQEEREECEVLGLPDNLCQIADETVDFEPATKARVREVDRGPPPGMLSQPYFRFPFLLMTTGRAAFTATFRTVPSWASNQKQNVKHFTCASPETSLALEAAAP